MKSSLAAQLSGRATGALFFTVFGMAWLLLWLRATERLSLLTGAAVGIGLLLLLLSALRVLRQARQLPLVEPKPAELARRARVDRLFNWVNFGQWAVILPAAWGLAQLGLQAYVLPLVVTVIGLHFLPLGQLFRYWPHYLTGVALVAWVAGSCLLLSRPEWSAAVALGAGLVLWLSAGYALLSARQALRRPGLAVAA